MVAVGRTGKSFGVQCDSISHDHDHDPGHHHERADADVETHDDWARRRRKGIPTDEQLLVVACMDERIPVEEALGIERGDAQIDRNAGGKVTDDVIRSAALTTQFFDTEEISTRVESEG